MDQPLFESQNVAVLFFLIHCLCGDLWELEKGLLIPFSEDHVFIIIIFFKINVWRAPLIDDSLDMLTIDLTDVR